MTVISATDVSEDNKCAEGFRQIRHVRVRTLGLCAASVDCLVPFVVEACTRTPGPPLPTRMPWNCARLSHR